MKNPISFLLIPSRVILSWVAQSLTVSLLAALWSVAAHAVTLEEAFQASVRKSETVGQQQELVNQAQEQVRQARGSVLPNLALNGIYLRQPRPSDPVAREIFPEQQTTANISLTQPIFRGFREFAGIRQRRDIFSSQEQVRNQSIHNLYQQVAENFINILAAEKDIENLQDQLKIYEDRIKELRGRVRRGESSETEVLTIQTTQAALQAELQLIIGNLKVTRETFRFLTGLPADTALTDPKVFGESGIPKTMKLEEYLANIEKRPDVLAAQKRADATSEEIKVARGVQWPTIDLLGNYYLKRPPGYTEEIDWDVQIRATMPLYEGGVIQSQTREAASRYHEAQLEVEKIRRQADTDIRSFHQNLLNRAEQIVALEKAVELGEKNYQFLQRDYRRGLARNVDVQLALTNARISKRTLDQARFSAQLDLIRLQVAAVILNPTF